MLDLIETSWNVKVFVCCAFLLAHVGFNRNIVECKDDPARFYSSDVYRFNRNIVECKDVHDAARGVATRRFNRNIVECKVSICSIVFLLCPDLIETSWNVKLKEWEKKGDVEYRFNRNIVECKDLFGAVDAPECTRI